MCSGIENEIYLMLDCPVYKDLRDKLFLGILGTEEINLSFTNLYEKLRILFTQESLKSHQLLGDCLSGNLKW